MNISIMSSANQSPSGGAEKERKENEEKEKENLTLRMGDLLMQGWKLRGQSCPLCNTALMSREEAWRCVKCDLPVLREKEMTAEQREWKSERGQKKDAVEKELENSHAESKLPLPPSSFVSLEDAKKEYDRKNRKKQDEVSSRIGERMLQGWRLLGTQCATCETTPLMSHDNGPRFCVLCNRYVDKTAGKNDEKLDSEISHSEPTSQPKHSLVSKFDMDQIPTLDPDTGDIAIVSKVQHCDDNSTNDATELPELDSLEKWSQAISTKLLQGFLLLDEVCLRKESGCNGDLPLLQDTMGEKYCVRCGFHNKPFNPKKVEPKAVVCDDEDDDEDDDLLNDEIAFKIQTATQNAFLKGQNSGLSNATSTPSNAIMHSSPEICANASSTSLKNDVLDHIDKKLRSTSSRLGSQICDAEAIECANLISALATARKLVQDI